MNQEWSPEAFCSRDPGRHGKGRWQFQKEGAEGILCLSPFFASVVWSFTIFSLLLVSLASVLGRYFENAPNKFSENPIIPRTFSFRHFWVFLDFHSSYLVWVHTAFFLTLVSQDFCPWSFVSSGELTNLCLHSHPSARIRLCLHPVDTENMADQSLRFSSTPCSCSPG